MFFCSACTDQHGIATYDCHKQAVHALSHPHILYMYCTYRIRQRRIIVHDARVMKGDTIKRRSQSREGN